MQDENSEEQDTGGEPSNRAPLIALSMAIGSVCGAVLFGYFLLDSLQSSANQTEDEMASTSNTAEEEFEPTFLELTPIMISLGDSEEGGNLRFEGYLDVQAGGKEEVELIMPRIQDTLNTYLRAIGYSDLESPGFLLKLRLHMLRRVQIVAGDGLVNDLLISKFLIQ